MPPSASGENSYIRIEQTERHAIGFQALSPLNHFVDNRKFFNSPFWFNGGSSVGGGVSIDQNASYHIQTLDPYPNDVFHIRARLQAYASASVNYPSVDFWEINSGLVAEAQAEAGVKLSFATDRTYLLTTIKNTSPFSGPQVAVSVNGSPYKQNRDLPIFAPDAQGRLNLDAVLRASAGGSGPITHGSSQVMEMEWFLKPTQPADQFYDVPLIVNVYRNSGIARDRVEQAVAIANNIYNPAKVHFTIKQVKENVDNPGGDPLDSSWSETDGEQVCADGLKELATLNSKGLKLSFAHLPVETEMDTNGIAEVGSGRVALVRRFPSTDLPTSMLKTGNTVAHELGHLLGLPHSADLNAIMFRNSDRTGTTLTNDQIQVIRAYAAERGTAISKPTADSPSFKLPKTFGAGVSSMFDTSRDFNIAKHAETFTGSSGNMHTGLDLGGLIPVGGTGQFKVLFNTDANLATGATVGTYIGIDRILSLNISGPNAVTASLTNSAGQIVGGSVAWIERILLEAEVTAGDPPDPLATRDRINVEFAASAMPLTSGVEPLVAVISGNTSGPLDSYSFALDIGGGPALASSEGDFNALLAAPTFSITGTGYDPLESVKFYLNDIYLTEITTDNSGMFATNLNLPSGLANLEDFFLVGQGQDSGDYASLVISSVPEPTSATTIAVVTSLALIKTRRRRV